MVNIKQIFRRGINPSGKRGNVELLKTLVNPARNARSPVMAGTVPISPASNVVAGAGLARSAGRAIKSVFQRATGNPLASGGVKGLASRIGGRALGYGLAVEAFQYQRSKAKGVPFNPIPNLGSVLAFAVNPISAFGGTIIGGTEKVGKEITDIAKERLPQSSVVDFGQPTFNFTLPEVPIQAFPSELPSTSFGAPSASYGTSFNPSISVGGGGIPPELLLLLIGGAGLVGYGAGRRRKRKKYKRKKRKK